MQNTNESDLNLPVRVPLSAEHSRPPSDIAALERLLDEWMQGDAAEQRETFDLLRRSLDEDRPGGYKLFS